MGIDGRKWAMQKPNKNDHRNIEIAASIARVILFPIFLIVRLYFWVWDYDYTKKFKH